MLERRHTTSATMCQSPTVTITWYTSTYKVYKLHQRYTLCMCLCVCVCVGGGGCSGCKYVRMYFWWSLCTLYYTRMPGEVPWVTQVFVVAFAGAN